MIAPPGLARRHRLCRAAPAECKRCSRSLVRSELATRIFAACPHRHPNFRISQCPSPRNLYLRPTVVGCSGFRASLPDHGSARSSPRFTGWRAVSRVGLRHNPTGRRWRPGDLKARVLAWRLQPEAQFCDVVLRRSATRPCIAWSVAKRELIRSVDLFKTDSAAGDCTNGCPARRCGRQRRDRREVYSAVLQDRRTAGRCLRRPLAVDAGGVTEEGADVFPDPAVRTVITTRAAPSHKGAVGQTAMHMPDRDSRLKGRDVWVQLAACQAQADASIAIANTLIPGRRNLVAARTPKHHRPPVPCLSPLRRWRHSARGPGWLIRGGLPAETTRVHVAVCGYADHSAALRFQAFWMSRRAALQGRIGLR